jgi:hypothetical protein
MHTDFQRDTELRQHLVYLLQSGGAHIDLRAGLVDFPLALINKRIGRLPYTPWQVLEHLRIAQWDILEFSRNENHVSPKFPDGYWPPASQQADLHVWESTIKKIEFDLTALVDLVSNPKTDLFAPISHGEGQTILREALLVADHNAYHLGSLITMKKMEKD